MYLIQVKVVVIFSLLLRYWLQDDNVLRHLSWAFPLPVSVTIFTRSHTPTSFSELETHQTTQGEPSIGREWTRPEWGCCNTCNCPTTPRQAQVWLSSVSVDPQWCGLLWHQPDYGGQQYCSALGREGVQYCTVFSLCAWSGGIPQD